MALAEVLVAVLMLMAVRCAGIARRCCGKLGCSLAAPHDGGGAAALAMGWPQWLRTLCRLLHRATASCAVHKTVQLSAVTIVNAARCILTSLLSR